MSAPSYIRMCDCGTHRLPPKPTLPVMTDGTLHWCYCSECDRAWDVDTLREIPRGNWKLEGYTDREPGTK